MSRSKQFNHMLQVKLTQLEWALVRYYAEVYHKNVSDIVRGMLRQYVKADRNFDAKAFVAFVEKTILPEEKGDKLMRAEIRRQVEEFVATQGR